MNTNSYAVVDEQKSWLLNDAPVESELLHRELVYQIVGCALEVVNELGHGFHEKPYENALVVALSHRGIDCVQQPSFDILFRGVCVSEYIPDLIVKKLVVVDTKVVDRITDHERGQMINYLRVTKCRVGVIINFKRAKLEWERIVL